MMAGHERRIETVFFDFLQETIEKERTSEVWAAHLMVTLTPANTSAHVLPEDTGVGASVVGLETKILTILI